MKGGWYLLNPLAFPSGRIINWMWDNVPSTAQKWNQDMIQDMYALYSKGIENGLPIFKKGQAQIIQYILGNSNFQPADVRLFCYALMQLAQNGQISTKWYNPAVQIRKNVIEQASTALGPKGPLNKTLSNIKWIGILALSGIALYYSFPLINTIRRRIK